MASTSTLRQRPTTMDSVPNELVSSNIETDVKQEGHPAGEVKHGQILQVVRGLLLATYFMSGCLNIMITQLLGSPLYFVNRDLYYAFMALTKQSFGLIITTGTQWFSPTTIRISGDESIAGQMRKTNDGRVEFQFPERLLLIANHQIYSDWLYLWWISYANAPQMHGHIYIILKDTLRYIPILGVGMMFYGFIFMSRKMASDAPRLAHRLAQLKARHAGPLSGASGFDPMWLLIFPEGTNSSNNGRLKSSKWAEKQGIEDLKHVLLPRSTGTFFVLNELKGTVDWVYDCTVAYEGIPRGQYGQDIFTLKVTQLEGRPPKSVNIYWRRFAVSSLPLDDASAFDAWMNKIWREKDELMEQYISTGRFPASKHLNNDALDWEGRPLLETSGGFIETEVKTKYWWEWIKIFSVLAMFGFVANILAKIYNLVFYGDVTGWKQG